MLYDWGLAAGACSVWEASSPPVFGTASRDGHFRGLQGSSGNGRSATVMWISNWKAEELIGAVGGRKQIRSCGLTPLLSRVEMMPSRLREEGD